MNALTLVLGAILAVGAITLLLVLLKRRPRRLKVNRIADEWQELQKLCNDKATWPEAIIRADKLLGMVLKKRKYKGHSFGERLVSAQRDLTDNDGVWYGHKLCKKLIEEPEKKLKEVDVRDALMGIRQALKDLGAMK